MTSLTTEAIITVDRGSPEGDYTGISVRCVCGRLYTMTHPANLSVQITGFACKCGYWCSPAGASGCGHVPAGYSCVTPGCSNGPAPEPSGKDINRGWVDKLLELADGSNFGSLEELQDELCGLAEDLRSGAQSVADYAPEPSGEDVSELRVAAVHLMQVVKARGHNDYGSDCHICRAIMTVERLSETKDDKP